jgi:MurNAc alpha-1-phosphate uridylyltransferase
MQAAILAGGLATRLGSITKNQPKSLVPIKGKVFLEYQLEFLADGGVKDIVLCLGHLGKMIPQHLGNGNRYGLHLEYSFEEKPLGTAGALKKAETFLEDSFFTLYGDSYLTLDFYQVLSMLKSTNKLGAMTVFKNHDRYERSNTAIKGNLVSRYSKNCRTQDMVYIDYGVNALKKEVLKMVPKDRFYSLEDLFIRLIGMKELLAFEVKERFYEIGSLRGLQEFEQYVAEGMR